MTRIRGAWLGALLLALGCAAGSEAPPSGQEEPPRATPAPPSPVLTRQDEAPREACAHGGARVRSGLDVNGDGVLDDTEVQHTSHVCYPAPVEPERVESRVRVEPVSAEGACVEGGSAVLSGVDTNRDGTLDADEVLHREVVCREHLLTHLTPAGPACPGEGTRLDVGRDLDADGVLAPREVVATQVSCSDVLTGNILVRTAEELAALAPVRAIVGSLDFAHLPVERVALPRLEAVTGDLLLRYQDQVTSLSLPALTSVGGDLRLEVNARLVEATATKLRWVNGTLAFGGNPLLSFEPAWSSLESVGGLSLSGAGRLVDLRAFPQLRYVRGNLVIVQNPALVDVSLTFSLAVDKVFVSENPALRTLALDVPDSGSYIVPAFGEVWVGFNPALTTVSLGCFWVRENLFLGSNPALTDVTVTAVEIKGYVSIQDDSRLTRLHFSRLSSIGGGLRLNRSPLQQLTVTRPFSVRGELIVSGTWLTALTDEQLGPVYGDATIAGNPRLASLQLAYMRGGLRVSNNESLSSLTLHETEVLPGSLTVSSNPLLRSLSGLQVKDIRGSLEIYDMSRLARIDLPGLRWVHEDVLLLGQDIQDAGLEDLESVGGMLRVGGTGMIRWKGLGALRYVGHSVFVHFNPWLEDVKLPRLSGADWLNIADNPRLTRLSLPVFSSSARATVTSNAALPVCEVDRFFTQLPAGVGVQSGNDANGTCAPP